MTWKDHLKRVKGEIESFISPVGETSHQQGQQQSHQQSYPPPPLPPPDSRPAERYWQPRFQADAPVTAEWDAKLGNGPDGWGNQELEHYTASPANAFQ